MLPSRSIAKVTTMPLAAPQKPVASELAMSRFTFRITSPLVGENSPGSTNAPSSMASVPSSPQGRSEALASTSLTASTPSVARSSKLSRTSLPSSATTLLRLA